MMTNFSTGDTVKATNSNNSTIHGECSVTVNKRDPVLRATRKRRRLELSSTNTDVPQKTQRRNEQHYGDENAFPLLSSSSIRCEAKNHEETRKSKEIDVLCDANARQNRSRSKRLSETTDEGEREERQMEKDAWMANPKRKKQELMQHIDVTAQDTARKPVFAVSNVRDESQKLRKTIQWLEEGARRLREDLANARSELHEEKRAAKIAKREVEAAIREARAAEAAKYQIIISELKNRLSRGGSSESNCTSPSPSSSPFRADFMKDENHRREVSAMKKRLAESEKTIRRLKWETLNSQTKAACRADGTSCIEVRRLETEIHSLRANNEKLEAKLRIAVEAEKARTTELRVQHENHEAELSALRKSLRSETIKMMDELRGKNREIEKLSKLLQTDNSRKRRKSATKDNTAAMHKLQDGEKNGPIRSNSRMEKKFLGDDHTLDSYIRDAGCDKAIAEVEVERLRELALEQQEVIEILRQTVKEKERKLEQLSNKRRKEEFYRQWLELEPVAEVDDEEDHEEGDSALSSAPSSLSPQPGGCGQWQGSGVTREAYEAVLVEIEELQSKLLDERQELSRAKAEVRDLEKALLQETRCGSRNKQVDEFNDKLRAAEEREANLLAELSELREQNELLEFRLLELEESPAHRDSPDHTADSGIVSPELIHPNKDRTSKQRNRAVATVIPYTNNNSLAATRAVSPVPRKPPLSLQESGIFEEDAAEEEEEILQEEEEEEEEVGLTTCGTQTDVPSGELLQEVQRLQELRARIQERAAKVTNSGICSIDPPRISYSFDSSADVSVDSIVQLSSYQERVRELEEKVAIYEETEEKRAEERRLSKQREEELLDENYRLTERVYWLENKLQNLEELIENRSASRDGYRSNVSEGEEQAEEERNDDFARSAGEKGEKDFQSVDVSVSTANAMEVEMEEDRGDFEGEVNGGENCSKAVQVARELLEGSIEHCPRCKTRNATNSKDETDRWRTIAETHGIMVEVVQNSAESVEEVAKEAKEEEEEENGTDEIDSASRWNCGETNEGRSISQIHVRTEEENLSRDESTEQTVTFNETESEKKVIYFRWR